MPDYRERGIDFTTVRNIIKYCALAKIGPFFYEFIAKKMNTDPAFLRYWNQDSHELINKVLETHRKEIEEEVNNLKSET